LAEYARRTGQYGRRNIVSELVEVRKMNSSSSLLSEAMRYIPLGVSSSMRNLPYQLPIAVKRAEGAKIWDMDDNELIDLNMAYGPLIFGHRPKHVLDAIKAALEEVGCITGFAHPGEQKVARLIVEAFPSVERLRFSSTGTEACQTAVRLARAHTNRPLIILFEGHYHGSGECVFHRYHGEPEEMDRRGSRNPIPGTLGMGIALQEAIVLPWNNAEVLEDCVEKLGDQIAAVMMEPVMGNATVIPPNEGYLERARDAATRRGIVLIFDEVITGFRVARGGCQERYNVKSDLTTLAKAMSGGVPVTCVGGQEGILRRIAEFDVFHGGVYSGNPMCIAGALAAQEMIHADHDRMYTNLELCSDRLKKGLEEQFLRSGVPVKVSAVGAMMSLIFLRDGADGRIEDYRSARKCMDADAYKRFQRVLQEEGVFVHPNPYEPWYLSTAHTTGIVDEILNRIGRVLSKKNVWLSSPRS
jgi:glutamate-1-semialdehyde 2,1-aminomutase